MLKRVHFSFFVIAILFVSGAILASNMTQADTYFNASSATITLSLDKTQYTSGENQTLTVSISGEQGVDAYLAIVYPTGEFYCLLLQDGFSYGQANSASPILSSWTTIAGSYPLTVTLPSLTNGEYSWYGIFTEAGQSPLDLNNWTSFSTQSFSVGSTTVAGDDIVDLGGGVSLSLKSITGGSYSMGAPADHFYGKDNEKPQHTVTVGDFYIGQYEVTNAQYVAFLNDRNESHYWASSGTDGQQMQINKNSDGTFTAISGQENHPVLFVTWDSAKAFCDWLTAKTGNTYRLPTEAEWEYAYRSGTSTGYYWGNDASQTNAQYNRTTTASAGSFAPNSWGLYDMAGNALEWCNDWYNASYYSSSPSDNPQGPSTGVIHSLRGGSAWDEGFELLAFHRDTTWYDWISAGWQDQHFYNVGFRVVRTTDAPTSSSGSVVDISTGQYHSVGVKNDGTVWTWGNNFNGELGLGITDSDSHSSPTQATGLSNIVSVAAGYSHTIALDSSGNLWSWGFNGSGQLGDGTTTSQTSPTQITGISNVSKIASANLHVIALKTDGTVWTWGYNGSGQLGIGADGFTQSDSKTPVQVTGLSDITDIAAGGSHSLALKSDGTVWAWGKNSFGQIGLGHTNSTYNQEPSPQQITALSDVTSIAAGWHHSIAVKSDGTVWCWGSNVQGQLGDGNGGTDSSYSSTPVQATGVTTASKVGAGWYATFAILSDGTVMFWGSSNPEDYNIEEVNLYGGGNIFTTATQISGLQSITKVRGGRGFNLALQSNGNVWGWGNNFYGQLGDGTTNNHDTHFAVSW